jgi:Zn-dependent protease
MLNLFLCIFNLVPIPPLDGSSIFQNLSPAYRRLFDGPQAQLLALGLFAALFFVGSDYLFNAAFGVADLAIRRSLSVLVPTAGTP